jgi:uncharacterized membrane protein
LFDLIRRKFIEAIPVESVQKTWAGLKEDVVSDLAVKPRDVPLDDLYGFEREVYDTIVKAAEGEEQLLLSEMKGKLKDDPTYYSSRFSGFVSDVNAVAKEKAWWVKTGRRTVGWAVFIFLGLTIGALFLPAMLSDGHWYLWHIAAYASAIVVFGVNFLGMLGFLIAKRGWERRTREAATTAARWSGFKRFLTDFAGMKEAVPGSIEIWERFLVYGIAFGVADRVLAAAQLKAPAELADQSNIYFISRSRWRGGLVADL